MGPWPVWADRTGSNPLRMRELVSFGASRCLLPSYLVVLEFLRTLLDILSFLSGSCAKLDKPVLNNHIGLWCSSFSFIYGFSSEAVAIAATILFVAEMRMSTIGSLKMYRSEMLNIKYILSHLILFCAIYGKIIPIFSVSK